MRSTNSLKFSPRCSERRIVEEDGTVGLAHPQCRVLNH